jgi:hypothetical protein
MLNVTSKEALIKIAGVMPAYMRPRKLTEFDTILFYLTSSYVAYGEYNNIVREVSGARGQTLVNWDFECALTFFSDQYVCRLIVLPYYKLW